MLHIDCSQYLNPEDTKLLTVALGPTSSNCSVEKFIYFIRANDPHILAYDILEQKWIRRLLISAKFENIPNKYPVQPVDLTFGTKNPQELLISDADGHLYSTLNTMLETTLHNSSLNDNIILTNTPNSDEVLEIELLGSLLGPSKNMMCDHVNGLFYVYSKFGAIVRSVYKPNMTAEDNEVIFVTPNNIQQIFFGVDSSVWLITDRWLKPQDECFKKM